MPAPGQPGNPVTATRQACSYISLEEANRLARLAAKAAAEAELAGYTNCRTNPALPFTTFSARIEFQELEGVGDPVDGTGTWDYVEASGCYYGDTIPLPTADWDTTEANEFGFWEWTDVDPGDPPDTGFNFNHPVQFLFIPEIFAAELVPTITDVGGGLYVIEVAFHSLNPTTMEFVGVIDTFTFDPMTLEDLVGEHVLETEYFLSRLTVTIS